VPHSNITATVVVWNDERRLKKLLKHLRPYCERIVVGVQASPDHTLQVAEMYADTVVRDIHHGFGDATYGPLVLPEVRTDWTFKVDADEWPNEELLASLGDAVKAAHVNSWEAVLIEFKSSIDGQYWDEQHFHMRLFQTRLGWPDTMHSRPATDQAGSWVVGNIRHDRSLDEMIQDYLNYYRIGGDHWQWEEHNRMMMFWACCGTANVKGWEYVRSFPWWPQVEAISFKHEKPWEKEN